MHNEPLATMIATGRFLCIYIVVKYLHVSIIVILPHLVKLLWLKSNKDKA